MAMKLTKRSESAWRCSCGGPHFLTLTRWGDGEVSYMDLGGSFRAGSGRFWARAKIAWQLLRHGHATDWVEVILDDTDKIDDVIANLRLAAEDLRKGGADDGAGTEASVDR